MFKSIISKWALPTLLAIGSMDAFAQADQVISGGYSVSSFICGNRKLYTMGVGIGLTPVNVKIIDENNRILDARQVNSGLDYNFVAIDCNSDVWAWGGNYYGQLGNGVVSFTAPGQPTRVLAGPKIPMEFKKTIANKDYLTGAKVVNGGMGNAFAILNNGTVAGWGHNSSSNGFDIFYNHSGQLGDSTFVDALAATLVIDGTTKKPLTNVTMVYAANNVTYALANGKVYSWGNGILGMLGRNSDGGVWDKNEISNIAFPITFPAEAGIPVKIAAGSFIGMMLDNKGYVWTWGDGSLYQLTGWGTNTTSGVPARVIKGTTSGADNDGTYLLAKDISGGFGIAMAVTVSGSPVAWGGEGCSNGGITGNGTMNGTPIGGPGYILTSNNEWHKDVIKICSGSEFGFYVRKDNSIWTWGCNTGNFAGVLGIGNAGDQPYAVYWTPPIGCGMLDPMPFVSLSPKDTSVCTSNSANITLKSGLDLGVNLLPEFTVKWYKNGDLLQSQTADKGLTYVITTPQIGTKNKYKVEVSYTGTNGGCNTYPIAKDSMTISAYSASSTVCGINGDGPYYPIPLNANIIESDTITKFKKGRAINSTCTTGIVDTSIVDVYYTFTANSANEKILLSLIDTTLLSSAELIDPSTFTSLAGKCFTGLTGANRAYNLSNLNIGQNYLLRLELGGASLSANARISELSKVFTVLQTSTVTSVDEQLNLTNVLVYPNPAQDVIHVQLGDVFEGNISLVDVRGNEVISKSVNGTNFSFATDELSSGVYIVKINSDKIAINKQVVILK